MLDGLARSQLKIILRAAKASFEMGSSWPRKKRGVPQCDLTRCTVANIQQTLFRVQSHASQIRSQRISLIWYLSKKKKT